MDIDYTVTNAGEESGGDINLVIEVAGNSVFETAPSDAFKLVLVREPILTQSLDLIGSGAFLAEEVEKALDRMTYQIQRISEKIGRSYLRDITQTEEIILDPSTLGYQLTAINLNDALITGNLDFGGFIIDNIKGIFDNDGDTGVYVEFATDEDKVRMYASNTLVGQFDGDGLTLISGVSVNEFSIDGTLGGDSDDAIPTEKAVKTYVDAEVSGVSTRIRAATFIVAASDSIDTTRADYVCDGTADDVQINAAITACTSGGRVILLEGTYNIAASVDLSVNNVTLQGQGLGTILKAITNLNAEVVKCGSNDGCALKDMKVENSTNSQGSLVHCVSFAIANDSLISNVHIEARMSSTAFPLWIDDCDRLKVVGCHFKVSTGGSSVTSLGMITIGGLSELCIFSKNSFDGSAVSTDQTSCISDDATGNMQYCVIDGNTMKGDNAECDWGIYIHGDYNIVSNNIVYNMGLRGCDFITGAIGNVMDGNVFRDGISDGGTSSVIGDNVVA